MPYAESRQVDQCEPVVQLDGKLVKLFCALFTLEQLPELVSRKYSVPPVPRIAIQYAVPDVTFVAGTVTVFQAPACNVALLP